MTEQATASFVAERSRIYWLLSHFFLEQPDRSFINELNEWLVQGNTSGDAGTLQVFDDVSSALSLLQSDEALLGLQKEYTRLFAGLRKNDALPPPYECVFREGRLAGDITVDVNHHYALAGFADIYPEAGPQDHLGVELRFMSLLCYEEHSAETLGDIGKVLALRNQQREFLDRHLLRWVPDYCVMLGQESRVDFYSGIATLTAYSLKTDSDMLERLVAA